MIRRVNTKNELIASYQIRKTVFIEEQHVSYEEEFDLLDYEYEVYLVYEEGSPVATARCKVMGTSLKVGRVCTLEKHRHHGHAKALMLHLIKRARALHCENVILDSQLRALPFYQRLGFVAVGDVFLDANIEHKKMIYQIEKIRD